MEVAPNLTPEEQRILDDLNAAAREADAAPPPSPELQARMDSEAETSGALMLDSTVHDRVMGMGGDEFEGDFADVLHANAHDDDDPAGDAADAAEGES